MASVSLLPSTVSIEACTLVNSPLHRHSLVLHRAPLSLGQIKGQPSRITLGKPLAAESRPVLVDNGLVSLRIAIVVFVESVRSDVEKMSVV